MRPDLSPRDRDLELERAYSATRVVGAIIALVFAPFLDVWSLLQMIVGPFGYTIGGYYDGLTVGGDFCKAL